MWTSDEPCPWGADRCSASGGGWRYCAGSAAKLGQAMAAAEVIGFGFVVVVQLRIPTDGHAADWIAPSRISGLARAFSLFVCHVGVLRVCSRLGWPAHCKGVKISLADDRDPPGVVPPPITYTRPFTVTAPRP